MHNVILSYIISKYTINHIKSSKISLSDWEWYKVKEKEKEEERNKKRVSEKVKTLEERKIENITL